MKTTMVFYTNLKEKRIDRGISQDELANELSVTVRTIHRIENMVNPPNVTLAIKIAGYFNTTVDDMFWIQ